MPLARAVEIEGILARFTVGDRVRGIVGTPGHHPKFPDRQGVVMRLQKSWPSLDVLWDGNLNAYSVHYSFVEHVGG